MSFKPEFDYMVNHFIYRVPDTKYPFLGVHFTRMVTDEREIGPNAVLALKIEGHTNKDFNLEDTLEIRTYVGFLNFLRKNVGFVMGKFVSSLSMVTFIVKAETIIPEVEANMLVKGFVGVRAQAINHNGKLLMNFNIERPGNQIHILNAPSPGAAASLAIADHIVTKFIT